MKKALILMPNGLGDVIMATPCLRQLWFAGYIVDMIVRTHVIRSHLLDNCPYIENLYSTKASGKPGAYKRHHMPLFNSLKSQYDWTGIIYLNSKKAANADIRKSRVKLIAQELKLQPNSWNLEVFISEDAKMVARRFLDSLGINEFVFVHTTIPTHPRSTWKGSTAFVKKVFPNLPIFDTRNMQWDDINITFALMAMAKRRVISNSVMIHACDALDCTMDAVNYESLDSSCYPLRENIIFRIYINGVRAWI